MTRHAYFPGIADQESTLERLERAAIAGKLDRRSFLKAAAAAGASAMALPALADELDAIRANQTERSAKLLDSYDYIVVGTGSSGAALVGRLSAQSDASILVIEAGDWDTAPSVMDPSVWFTNLGSERDWGDVALASPSTNGRAIPEHMGKVVGGGSSINATIWARPFKNDLEHWAKESGDAQWGYEHGLSIYRRMENWQGTPSPRYRGQGGPVWCQPAQDPHPLAPAMLAGCKSLGLPVFDDLNGVREERGSGFALMNHIIKNGQRNSKGGGDHRHGKGGCNQQGHGCRNAVADNDRPRLCQGAVRHRIKQHGRGPKRRDQPDRIHRQRPPQSLLSGC